MNVALGALGAHPFGESRHLAIYHLAGGFGRDISRGKTGAACRKDEVEVFNVRPSPECLGDLGSLIRDDFACLDGGIQPGYELGDIFAAGIHTLTSGRGVTDGKDADGNHGLRHHNSTGCGL